MSLLPIEDQENYNPVLQTLSPVKLVNQKRYKVLKELALQGRSTNSKTYILKEKIEYEVRQDTQKEAFKQLVFDDESTKTFGI